ncbi:glycosyltransferase family 4 protein [Odoribacter sp. OttesenSCG-928-L07]|nr:glycosyltransferase family 4 protein [Odoribacter sp. OttesenSCG-928-L07]MDL2239242.1 glycosyltransferase family 4 protein [Bacteroidales bacterium OttesenSCG-928-L14]MDL2240044.1 glycosyltransferase family 4 protein [Bacteroidales bacterium OttesenSCG-928-K22]
MRIGVNTRLLLSGRLEGIGMVTNEILKRITKNHPEHQFFFFFDRPYSEEFIFSDNVTPVVVHPQARTNILWYLFFEWGIPRALKKYKIDAFISTDGWVSLKTKVPTLNVVHDLNFVHYPEFFTTKKALAYYNKYTPKYIKRSDRIIAVSEYTKQDVINVYGADENLIDVVYNAASNCCFSLSQNEQETIRNKYSAGDKYFIYVGTFYKRKNLANLLRAFDKYKSMSSDSNKLMIVGNRKTTNDEIEDTYNNMLHKDSVIFTGYLPQDELNKVVASSIAQVYVSIFEGFGIPIVEAFNAETAVITSNTTSMPEVAGDAALIVDPYNVDEIANAMLTISNDENLRQQLIEKGRQRRSLFDWDKSAEKFWSSFEKMMLI